MSLPVTFRLRTGVDRRLWGSCAYPRSAQVVRGSPGTSTLPISSKLGQGRHRSCTTVVSIGLQSRVIAI